MKKLIKDLFSKTFPKLFSKFVAVNFREFLPRQWWKEQIKEINLTLGNVAAGNVFGGMSSLFVGFIITFFVFLIVNSCLPFDAYYEFILRDENNGKVSDIKINNKIEIISDAVKNELLVKVSEKDILQITFTKDKNSLKAVLSIFDQSQPQLGHEIEWWKTNNIAETNEVFKIENSLFILKSPSYPTSTSALVSWIREYGKKKIFNKEGKEIETAPIKDLSVDELKVDLCGQLERIFEKGCKFNNKGDLFLMFVRSVNGWIQFLCFTLFFAIGFMLFTRHRVFRLSLGDLTKIIDKKIKDKNTTASDDLPKSTNQINDSGTIPHLTREQIIQCELKKLSDDAKQKEEEFSTKWGQYCYSPQWFVWRNGLVFFISKSGHKYSSLAEIANAGRDAFAVSRLYIHWMLDAIPALGFLGTVIGIGRTMMGTGSILTDELGKQQSRISSVALDLAFAFDTTFVALLLSLIIGAWLTHRIRQEEDSINKVQHILTEEIQSQINEKN
jgi:hypothetical protein